MQFSFLPYTISMMMMLWTILKNPLTRPKTMEWMRKMSQKMGDYMGESSEESTDSSDSMVSLIDEDDMDLETDVQEPAQ